MNQEPKQITEPNQLKSSNLRLDHLNLNDCAVEIADMKFTYNKSQDYLLKGVTMIFPRSAIYGFLGPSGCGKTTIIKMICGFLKPSSGTVFVNGRGPRHPKNLIPGPGIGYMPQENSLLEVFTIIETFTYFGQIYGLSKQYINERIDFLLDFLQLPDRYQIVGSLSGGQQRRTSLGVAIIHKPPILILDEPTVGVDPMLRERIWEHLLKLSADEKTSIMITTHYINECQRADVVGLLRNGRILAENSPSYLLNYFKTDNLENVFLKLCRREGTNKYDIERPPDLAQLRTKDSTGSPTAISFGDFHCKPTFFKRFSSLFRKNATIVWKNKIKLVIEITLPVLSLIIFAISIGNKPFDLPIALNSEERRNTSVDNSLKLSELLLECIDKKTIILQDYDSQESALQSVRDGITYGVLYVNRNFSDAFRERIHKFISITNDVKSQSTIYFTGDLSDFNIFLALFGTFMEALFTFMPKVMVMSTKAGNGTDSTDKPNPNVLKQLIEITRPPIYGSSDPLFNEFLLPGILITGTFLTAGAMTTLTVIEERRKGLLERSLVAGAGMLEILLAMLSVHFFIVLLQTVLSVLVIYVYPFHFKQDGSYILIISLITLQSITGMSLGLFISYVADSTKMAAMVLVATIIPFLLISGILWPLEGMEWQFLRNISYCLPQTMAIKALRFITQKGWFINRSTVWFGFVIPIFWSIGFILLTVIISQFRND